MGGCGEMIEYFPNKKKVVISEDYDIRALYL